MSLLRLLRSYQITEILEHWQGPPPPNVLPSHSLVPLASPGKNKESTIMGPIAKSEGCFDENTFFLPPLPKGKKEHK